jgi:hypothetical protein
MAETRTGRRRKKKKKESISGFFRKIFEERPELLQAPSNDELRKLWLAAHPGQTALSQQVIQNLNNIKSFLRRQERASAKKDGTAAAKPRPRGLESLEELIDESLVMAKNLDRDALADVIRLLRRARNEVVWKIGGA